MTPAPQLIHRIKCFLGFHEWKDTGIRRKYGFVYTMKCARCGTLSEMTPENVSFGQIAGQEVMVIKR